MKKLLLSVLAISALVACSKSDVIEMPQSQAIKFGSAFVDNSTKAIDPSTTMDNFETFKVWGKLTPDVTNATSTNIFNGIDVTKSDTGNDIGTVGSTWFYNENNVQYWIPTVKYNFAAIAGTINGNVTLEDNMPSTIPYDVNTQTDLIYARTNTITGAANNNQTVSFTFDHLLSKAKFTFTNEYPVQSNLFVTVTDIQIVGAKKESVYTINNSATAAPWGTWGTPTNYYNLYFGDAVASSSTDENTLNNGVDTDGTLDSEGTYIAPSTTLDSDVLPNELKLGVSNYERLMIPFTYAASSFKISFKVKVYLRQEITTSTGTEYQYTEVTALSNKYTKSVASPWTVNAQIDLEQGYSYNFNIAIGGELDKIMFKVSGVNGWTEGDGNPSGEVDTEIEIPLS